MSSNDAFSAAEARHLAEPDDRCDRCGEPTDGSALCWYHADEAQGNLVTRSYTAHCAATWLAQIAQEGPDA